MKILAITSCPAGVAHTFIAKRSLQKAAKAMGHEIKVETQGAMGIENEITDKDIENADLVIFAADTKVDKSERFESLFCYETSVAAAVKDGQDVIKKAIEAFKVNK
ncbi:PTS system IIB component (Fru family) [Keratinibaculum paraultunense]|uniref:PTS system IIB component (Fru family) n=1 Tax=Keratinibaculum paraultunense TaxID=1278232 RepID=A0A4V2UU72_9FIRM|nr:PTS fructose transporter subunit IIB [Keratinibaculum paraultunense]QQY79285.1 PTS fructose transporter subunit IIB [Keratinibaculum paraultunense]TCS89417.1 PTS system IIB component (Fru family) [Keratinibaculum paraultunense]